MKSCAASGSARLAGSSVEGELSLPVDRLDDIEWLARNAASENQNLRGRMVQFHAGTIRVIDIELDR